MDRLEFKSEFKDINNRYICVGDLLKVTFSEKDSVSRVVKFQKGMFVWGSFPTDLARIAMTQGNILEVIKNG